MTESTGLAWGKKQRPNPGPPWCTKPKPCDYDRGSAYCPHRECRQKLEQIVKDLDNECTRLAVELSEVRAASRRAARE